MKKNITIAVIYLLFVAPVFAQMNKVSFNSDNKDLNWQVKSQEEIGNDYKNIFSPNYNASNWVKAIVPGTVFGSYVEAGLEKDPNFGDNIYKVDKKKYDRNFWYRTEYTFPADYAKGKKVWLNFEGVNRKADVYFNGQKLGMLDGFMNRGKYDITDLITTGKNVLALLVYWPTNPVPNHASPTYISSASWDWMPYVPGLLSGITDDVYLTTSGNVSIIDPWMRTDLPQKDTANLRLQVELKNNTASEQKGILKGVINPGNIAFVREIKIDGNKQQTFGFDKKALKELVIANPKLWWPNGYGDPNLYTCDLTYSIDGNISDAKQIKFGIKKYSYDTLGGVMHISINGERIYIKGGNWGMSEYMLRCRGEEYDLKLKLHKEMNYNMIRNWIGSTTDDEFYEACDKYGIMVWDDFWLNSHPNLPDDVQAFNMNAIEKIKRLRNHPCVAVWCGDNEGYPLPPLNNWLKENVAYFDGGDRWYHANSHSDGLSGSGPWRNFHPNWYFTKYPGGFGDNIQRGWGMRTEIGTAVFTTFESFKKFMPKDSWWPQNEMWDKHFFGKSAGNASPDIYFNSVNSSYGTATGIEDFCRKAQLVNIETNKAMYEGWQHHMWNDASGIMTWMSQSAYPSFVWQTYDYYYDLNGAYWGVKKACEPVHIQWSYADNSVKVINATLKPMNNLNATATIYNMDGKPVAKYAQRTTVNAAANAASDVFRLAFTTNNLAFGKNATASSTSKDAGDANAVCDGSSGSRWASNYTDNEWVYVDLGTPTEIASVILNWESAHATAYKLQLSDDGINWKDVYETSNGKGGVEEIAVPVQKTRYIKMQGIKHSSQWGYSLYEMEVYGKVKAKPDLTTVHFIKLELKDNNGKLVSDNFYWRNDQSANYTALNTLPKANVKVKSGIVTKGDKSIINATISNAGSGVAFAIHIQAVRERDGERLLPAIMNDNYFTLLPKESKDVQIEFDTKLLQGGKYKLIVEPYNK